MKDFIKKIIGKSKNKNHETIFVNLESIGDVKFNVYNNTERVRTKHFGNEKEALSYFLSTIDLNDAVLDVGASVGLFSIFTAKYSKARKVYSFEPDLETFVRLSENIGLNDLSNIKLFQIALSEKKGISQLYTDGTGGFAPTLNFQKDRKGAPSRAIEIKTETLDNLVQSKIIEVPENIKIDIEGAEILFLRGGIKTLEGKYGSKPRSIFLEIHPDFLSGFNSSESEVRRILVDSNYELVWESERESQIHTHWKAK